MHSVVMDSLEEYLSGVLPPAKQRDIEAHLDTCKACREEVRDMQEIGQLFSSLSPDDPPVPDPSFVVRVMQDVEAREAVPGIARLLGLDFAFGRRVIFASLMTLAVLGSYLVSIETDYTSGQSPEAVMADYTPAPQPTDRDHMLATLTSYEP